ncbi:MAG TPA: hypothetical protein VN457_00675, partial [Chlamydiales bacterium]|nr:hypothetical protein [Chlamydiales bacterium]
MLEPTSNLSTCQYLFNDEAQNLFPGYDRTAVNEAFATVIQVVDHLAATKLEALFLFGPRAYNAQCHIYALMTAQRVNHQNRREALAATLPPMAEEALTLIQQYDSSDKNAVDKRYLYLSFCSSFAFRVTPTLFSRVVMKTLDAMKATLPSGKARRFLKNSDEPAALRVHVARLALNRLYQEHLKRTLSSSSDPLYLELACLANENLQLPAAEGNYTLYTYPKLSGIVYFVDAVFKERIPLFFKVKVLTKEGQGSFSYCSQNADELHPKAPAIVFEMLAGGAFLTPHQCQDIVENCHTFPRRNLKGHHHRKNPCTFCKKVQVDVSKFRERFLPVLSKPQEMLYALGADYVEKNQHTFKPFFSNPIKYPQLTQLFQESLLNISLSFLSVSEPMNMSVLHVHVDTVAEASKPEFL